MRRLSVHLCVHTEKSEAGDECLLLFFSLLSETGLSVNLDLSISTMLTGWQAQGSTCLHPVRAGVVGTSHPAVTWMLEIRTQILTLAYQIH